VRWDNSDIETADDYTLLYGKGNASYLVMDIFSVCKRVVG
jgi:hypothetical protein